MVVAGQCSLSVEDARHHKAGAAVLVADSPVGVILRVSGAVGKTLVEGAGGIIIKDNLAIEDGIDGQTPGVLSRGAP